jgi:hypothetical protein
MNTFAILCVFACAFQLSLSASVPDNSVVNVRKVLRLILENAEVPVQQRQQAQRILDSTATTDFSNGQPPLQPIQPISQFGGGAYGGQPQQQLNTLPQRLTISMDQTTAKPTVYDTTGACRGLQQGQDAYKAYQPDPTMYVQCDGETGIVMSCAPGTQWVGERCDWIGGTKEIVRLPHRPVKMTAPSGYSNGIQQLPQRVLQQDTTPSQFVNTGYGQQPQPQPLPQRILQDTTPAPFVDQGGYGQQQPSQLPTLTAPVPQGYSQPMRIPQRLVQEQPTPAPFVDSGYGQQQQQLPFIPIDTTSTQFIKTREQVTDSTACLNVDPSIFVQLTNRLDTSGSTFVLCSHGTGLVMQCPPGTRWFQEGPTAGTCLPSQSPFDDQGLESSLRRHQHKGQELSAPVDFPAGYGQTPARIPQRLVQETTMPAPFVNSGYGQQQQLPAITMIESTRLRQDTPPVQAVTDSTACANVDSLTDVYLPHPVPSLFIKCSSGIGYVMSCPDTTTWNAGLVACTTSSSFIQPPPQPQPQPPQRLPVSNGGGYGGSSSVALPPIQPQPEPPRLSVPFSNGGGYGSSSNVAPLPQRPLQEPAPFVQQPTALMDNTNACLNMQPGDNVYLPKLDNPNQFIRCDNRLGYIMTCPNSLIWNTEINSCSLPQDQQPSPLPQQPIRLTAPSGYSQPQPQPQLVQLSYGGQQQQPARLDSTQACAQYGPSDDVYISNPTDSSTYIRCVSNVGYIMSCAPGTVFLGQSSMENPCVPLQSSGGSSSGGYGPPQQPQQSSYSQPQPQVIAQPSYADYSAPPAAPQPAYSQPAAPAPPAYSPPAYNPPAAPPAYSPPAYNPPAAQPDYSQPAYNPPAAQPDYSQPAAAAPAYAPSYNSQPSYGQSSSYGYGYGYDIGTDCTPGAYAPYQGDARYFLQCDNGKWKVQYCAPGTIWSQDAYVCVHDPVRLQQLVQMTLQGSGGYGASSSGGYGGY